MLTLDAICNDWPEPQTTDESQQQQTLECYALHRRLLALSFPLHCGISRSDCGVADVNCEYDANSTYVSSWELPFLSLVIWREAMLSIRTGSYLDFNLGIANAK
mmetsp:Transcript_55164/g.91826  ORF Transcript_55164/g.91826 Transcript_55164/m.91826 type:complete len:104 (+) Transcript_55164:100-411(+)